MLSKQHQGRVLQEVMADEESSSENSLDAMMRLQGNLPLAVLIFYFRLSKFPKNEFKLFLRLPKQLQGIEEVQRPQGNFPLVVRTFFLLLFV